MLCVITWPQTTVVASAGAAPNVAKTAATTARTAKPFIRFTPCWLRRQLCPDAGCLASAVLGDASNVAAKTRLPRSLWTGSISFGLVNVPVRVFSAVHEHKLRFHLVHAKDDGPIGYEKICKVEEKPVPNDEIVKAFEYRKGEFVQLTDEDFEAVQVEGQHTIDLEDFVPYEQIDPAFFAHTYLVGPQDGAERPYSLLVRATGGLRARGHRQVRHAEPPVPRLPARPQRDPDARAALLRRRGRRAGEGPARQAAERGQARARHGDAADRELLRRLEAGEVQGHVHERAQGRSSSASRRARRCTASASQKRKRRRI